MPVHGRGFLTVDETTLIFCQRGFGKAHGLLALGIAAPGAVILGTAGLHGQWDCNGSKQISEQAEF